MKRLGLKSATPGGRGLQTESMILNPDYNLYEKNTYYNDFIYYTL